MGKSELHGIGGIDGDIPYRNYIGSRLPYSLLIPRTLFVDIQSSLGTQLSSEESRLVD